MLAGWLVDLSFVRGTVAKMEDNARKRVRFVMSQKRGCFFSFFFED